MKNDIRIYGNTFDPKVIKDVKELTEKLEKTEDSEERLKLYYQRLNRAMELNAGIGRRPYNSFYPY